MKTVYELECDDTVIAAGPLKPATKDLLPMRIVLRKFESSNKVSYATYLQVFHEDGKNYSFEGGKSYDHKIYNPYRDAVRDFADRVKELMG